MRADLYERLYRRSLSRARVEIDTNGDGKADLARALNVLELARVWTIAALTEVNVSDGKTRAGQARGLSR